MEPLDYPLPKELIAQAPVQPRDASRLLVADRAAASVTDRHFSDILELIPAGDVLVLNDTKVFSASLTGRKKGTGGKVEVLLLEPSVEKNLWRCLVQPSLKEGQEIEFEDGVGAVFVKRDPDGIILIEFKNTPDVKAFAAKAGRMPLPPYIKREAGSEDQDTYQTVYAQKEGAVAAPTAGLHFTPQLLNRLGGKGVEILFVTLHVGYGTFKPVENPDTHRMHAEVFELAESVAQKINQAKAQNRKVWAVGTTTLRALETCVQNQKLIAGSGRTDLFIRPPFEFEAVDHLVTNFHLPKTTLLWLVSAFMGEEFRKKAYDHAIAEKYRFYSYGDAMVIL
jgi:S-adenosylmethionine:tRNA ribosyltransferase-isomerase